MELESLKLVMETLAQMGEQGKEAFIWWLFFDKALPIIGWIILLPITLFVVCKTAHTFNVAEQRMRAIRDLLNVGCSGIVWEPEYRDVMLRIKHLLEKEGK